MIIHLLVYMLHNVKERSYYSPRAIALLLFCCAQLIFSAAYAQLALFGRNENFSPAKFTVKKVSLPAPENKLLLKNIGGIMVLDARADTAHAGCMQKKVVKMDAIAFEERKDVQRVNRTPLFLQLKSGVQNEVQQFVNNYLPPAGADTMPGILMVLKKLWLSDEMNIDGKVNDSRRVPVHEQKKVQDWTSGADVQIEFYLRKGSDYYALYRYDTVIARTLTIAEYGPEYIVLALTLSLEKMAVMDNKITAIASRRKFSLEEISQHNRSAYNIPVLIDTALTRGVYMSFEEFKNNQPSQTGFTIKREKLADFLYLKHADGSEVVAREVWGYSDGKKAFVRAGDNFFVLQRVQHAFYVFGAKSLKWQESAAIPLAVAPATGGVAVVSARTDGYGMQLRPYQLDWATGNLY